MSAIYQLKTTQKIPATMDEVWKFISSPKNLKEITPNYMEFTITNEPIAEEMYAGMIISYRVRPLLNIPMSWVTEITHVQEKSYFVDEQRVGPYSIWHHQHKISSIEGGVLMEDIVSYKPPFGIFGDIANHVFIKKQLKTIFDYRYAAVERIFGSWS